jgi:hypothetical protein
MSTSGITGVKDVDDELATMVQWQFKGNAEMAFSHSTRAGMMLVKAVADGKAGTKECKQYLTFVGVTLYGATL